MAETKPVKITKAVVDKIQPGEIVWDAEIKGFGVRCQLKQRSYILKCAIAGKQKWITIGRHGSPFTPDMARDKARALLVEIKNGIDPTAKAKADKLRIKMVELAARYMADHAEPHKKKSSSETDRKLIDNHIIPLLGQLNVEEVSGDHVSKLQLAVQRGETAPKDPAKKQKEQRGGRPVRGGKGVANRTLALLSKMMNLAEDWGYRPRRSNPVIGVKRFKEKSNERYLSEDEIEEVLAALSELESEPNATPYPFAAIRMLMLTGCRLGEILCLKWDQVRLEAMQLALADSKTGPRLVHLSQPATDLLASIPRKANNPYVIVGDREGQHLVNLQKPWKRVLDRAQLSDARIHDLRHTYASAAIRMGVPLEAVGKLLGHSSSATTKRYAHLADDYIAKQAKRVGAIISGIGHKTAHKSLNYIPKKIESENN